MYNQSKVFDHSQKNVISYLKSAIFMEQVKHCSRFTAGDARGVMVIVVENGHGDTTRVQILGETDCISHSTNTLAKGINRIILP